MDNRLGILGESKPEQGSVLVYGTKWNMANSRSHGIAQVWIANANPCDFFFEEGDSTLVELRFSAGRVYTRPGTIRKKALQFFKIDINRLASYGSSKVEYFLQQENLTEEGSQHWICVIFHCKDKRIGKKIQEKLVKALRNR